MRTLACMALVTTLATLPASAHHAFSAEFDADLPIRIEGTITQVDWINPHAWVHVEITKDDGESETWMLEAGTPNTLLRRGLTRTVLQPGIDVIVRGYQSKDRKCNPICKGQRPRHHLRRRQQHLHGLLWHRRSPRRLRPDGAA